MTPEELEQRLLYRDGLMLIIDKPAGLPVHAGPKGGANLEDYLDALRFGLPAKPALAHRLDRDTSGCLVLGRHPKALRKLGLLFQSGKVRKKYWAVTQAAPAERAGTIDLPLAKRSKDKRSWWMKVDHGPEGKPSQTRWRIMGKGENGLCWLELEPLTGRTHQIRVHLAEIGCPIVGETIYAGRELDDRSGLPPLHLHSREITIPISANKDPITAMAEPPPHMVELLEQCGWKKEKNPC